MIIKEYCAEYCTDTAKLFYDTVHTINAEHYNKKQLYAWASPQIPFKKWHQSFEKHYAVVAIENGIVVGFGDMDRYGYLDRLYVHKNYQRRGIATAICDTLEMTIPSRKYVSHVSITAKPFFEKRGYSVVKKQLVKRKNVVLANYVMEKVINKISEMCDKQNMEEGNL